MELSNNTDKVINITDVYKLKITRVRDWSICFEYDGQGYLIHGKYECGEGSWQELYKRNLSKSGKYELIFMKSINGDEYVKTDFFGCRKVLVYSQINKEEFALCLTRKGIATGIMQKKLEVSNLKIKKLKKELNKIYTREREIKSLIAEIERGVL